MQTRTLQIMQIICLFLGGFTIVLMSPSAAAQTYVGTVNVTDFDVTNWAAPTEKLPYDTVETAATEVEVHISRDGRWKATGRLALLMPMNSPSGLDTSKGGNTKVLLWNKGHRVTITMEHGAVSVIRGNRVRATSATTFTLSDGNDDDFNARISDGALVLE